MIELAVSSPAFAAGEWIPDRYSGNGEDISPELHVEGLDDRMKVFVVTMDDLDHPLVPGFNHWIAWNIPACEVIPEGIPAAPVVESPIHAEQGIGYGKHRYQGPNPPFNWNHNYMFTVYALDVEISVRYDANKATVLKEAESHIIGIGRLMGKYQKRHR